MILNIKYRDDSFPSLKNSPFSSTITINAALGIGRSILSEGGIEEPELNAMLILARVVGGTKEDIILYGDRPLSPSRLISYYSLLNRRVRHEPLQYILGEVEFFSIPFKVNPDTFIPRYESESLIEVALKRLPPLINQRKDCLVMDLGTGSGCLAIALAHNIKHLKILASDISWSAVRIARENAVKNGVIDRVCLVAGDLFNHIKGDLKPFVAVICNPPYISLREVKGLQKEVKEYEPHSALCGGKDGLIFLRGLINEAYNYLDSPGLILVEVGEGQADKVVDMMLDSGIGDVDTQKDLAGIDRVVYGYR